jgi:hypothetical protein
VAELEGPTLACWAEQAVPSVPARVNGVPDDLVGCVLTEEPLAAADPTPARPEEPGAQPAATLVPSEPCRPAPSGTLPPPRGMWAEARPVPLVAIDAALLGVACAFVAWLLQLAWAA